MQDTIQNIVVAESKKLLNGHLFINQICITGPDRASLESSQGTDFVLGAYVFRAVVNSVEAGILPERMIRKVTIANFPLSGALTPLQCDFLELLWAESELSSVNISALVFKNTGILFVALVNRFAPLLNPQSLHLLHSGALGLDSRLFVHIWCLNRIVCLDTRLIINSDTCGRVDTHSAQPERDPLQTTVFAVWLCHHIATHSLVMKTVSDSVNLVSMPCFLNLASQITALCSQAPHTAFFSIPTFGITMAGHESSGHQALYKVVCMPVAAQLLILANMPAAHAQALPANVMYALPNSCHPVRSVRPLLVVYNPSLLVTDNQVEADPRQCLVVFRTRRQARFRYLEIAPEMWGKSTKKALLDMAYKHMYPQGETESAKASTHWKHLLAQNTPAICSVCRKPFNITSAALGLLVCGHYGHGACLQQAFHAKMNMHTSTSPSANEELDEELDEEFDEEIHDELKFERAKETEKKLDLTSLGFSSSLIRHWTTQQYLPGAECPLCQKSISRNRVTTGQIAEVVFPLSSEEGLHPSRIQVVPLYMANPNSAGCSITWSVVIGLESEDSEALESDSSKGSSEWSDECLDEYSDECSDEWSGGYIGQSG